MALVVHKYGGKTLATPSLMKKVAERVVRTRSAGNEVVVVVSAPGETTDQLIDLAHQITSDPDDREMDMLLATGEQQSIALVAIAIKALGYDAISFTGPQVGIVTDEVHGKARIVKVGSVKIRKALDLGKIVIVAGFQGENEAEDITTLGRGGSDLTAVALAASLGADLCEFYKDVDGVFTANPKVVPTAKKQLKVAYEEMLEFASLGAQVLNSRSVLFAKKNNVTIHVRSVFHDEPGTIISEESDDMEQLMVSGITANKDEAKLSVLGIKDQPGIAARLFKALANAELNVDMIIQNVSEGGMNNISFTVPKADLVKARKVLNDVSVDLSASGVQTDEAIAKVSAVGVGMKSHSGVAAEMFECLAEKDINIQMISTSEIKISCVVSEDKADAAVRALHTRFGLDKV